MDLLNRPVTPDPYDLLPATASFTLKSNDLNDNESMPSKHSAAGGNISPHLEWSEFPAETKSFVLTCFDPDAPTPAGFWHWTIVDIPLEQTSIETDGGQSDLTLDGTAFHIRNDAGDHSYYGAAPPSGDRPHRYIFVVHALDVETLSPDPDDSATLIAFKTLFHTVARARLTVTFAQ